MDFSKVKDKLPLAIFILVLFVGMGVYMIIYADKRVRKNLLEELAPIEALCRGVMGCPAIPDGWIERECPYYDDLPQINVCASPQTDSMYRTLVYKASPEEFVIWWSYVSDSYIKVQGGKSKQMFIEEFAMQNKGKE